MKTCTVPVHVFRLALLLSGLAPASPTTAPSSSPGTLSVVGFNVQVFGVSKMGKPEVVAVLVDIITRHDLVVVQEIRDASGTGEPEFTRYPPDPIYPRRRGTPHPALPGAVLLACDS